MPTKEDLPSLLITQDDDVPKERFFIASTKNPIDEGEILYADNTEVVLADDASLGSRFFGFGIIRSIVEAGKQAILMTSKGKEIILPEGDGDE